MACKFNGGTDRLDFTVPSGNTLNAEGYGSFALKFRTTMTTQNSLLLSRMTTGSRAGWMCYLNRVASSGLLSFDLWNGTTLQGTGNGTAVVNDGNWHWLHFLATALPGNQLKCYIDGVLDSSVTIPGGPNVLEADTVKIGWGNLGFWASLVGEVAEFAHWRAIHLTTDDIASMVAGFSPRLVRPSTLQLYAPMVRAIANRAGSSTLDNVIGTTVADHPRVMGGTI